MVLESADRVLLLVQTLCRIGAVGKAILFVDEVSRVATQRDVRD